MNQKARARWSIPFSKIVAPYAGIDSFVIYFLRLQPVLPSQIALFDTSQQADQPDSQLTETRPDRVLAQHNDLVRAQYDMSLLELRLFIAMLARINRGDKEFSTFRIPVSELYPDDKVGGKTYAQIKKAVMRLSGRTITIESKDEKGMREIISNPIMAMCRYKEKSGHVTAQFNNFVKPFLLELKGDFSVAQELTLTGLRSFYSFRIYWLLKLSSFNRDSIQVGLPQMKKMFNLEGKYGNFADFRRFVLDIAQQELTRTDLAFDYAALKEGRTVTGVQFNLLRPAMTALLETDLPVGVQQRLTELGIALKSLHEIKLRYQQGKLTEEYIRFVLQHYDQAQNGGRIRSLPGAIYKGLTTTQLSREYGLWKAAQPSYKAPASKPQPVANEELISLDELRESWETMHKKGLTDTDTFEQSLAKYESDPNYRFESRDGVRWLIYLAPGGKTPA